MHLAFDAKRLYHNFTGLGNYSRTLVRNLVALHPEYSYHLYTPKLSNQFQVADFQTNTAIKKHVSSHRFGGFWRTFQLAKQLQHDGIEVFHGLSHELPYGIHRTNIKTIVTMHDLIWRVYPKQYPWLQTFIYDQKAQYACRNAHKIIAISEQTKQDIIRFYGTPSEKIEVIYQTCDEGFKQPLSKEMIAATKEKFGLPSEYLLYVGSIIERKNLHRILLALAQTRSDLPLVVVGNGGGAYRKKINTIIQENNLGNRVFFTQSIDLQYLPAIYQGASLFLYPSIYEGFGIPIIEALNSNVPVLTSNISCLPEAAGENSCLINPFSVEEIAAGIDRILENPTLQNTMKQAGKHFVQRFDKEVVTAQMMACYF
jgi:glycosyltransferase involved in cell wall biosynthesis